MLKRTFPWLCAVAIFLGPLHIAFVSFVSPGPLRLMSVAEKMKETAPMCVEIPCAIQAQIVPVALAPSVRDIIAAPPIVRTVIEVATESPHHQLSPASNRIRAPDLS
jgi:hypothetical protein